MYFLDGLDSVEYECQDIIKEICMMYISDNVSFEINFPDRI